MALKFFDAVQQLATGTGTGALVLGNTTSAKTRRLQDAGMVEGDSTYVRIQHAEIDAEWEVVKITYAAGAGLITRSFDEHSFSYTGAYGAGGSLVAFSAGNKIVSSVPLASIAKVPREKVLTPLIVGGALALNLNLGSVFTLPVTANITSIDIQNEVAGYGHSFTIEFTANGTGYTQVWPWTWINGTPVLTTTNGKRDLAVVWSIDGVNFFAAMVAQNY